MTFNFSLYMLLPTIKYRTCLKEETICRKFCIGCQKSIETFSDIYRYDSEVTLASVDKLCLYLLC